MKRSLTRAWSRGKTPTIILSYWMNDELTSRKTERSSQTNGFKT